jgi:hypothetical protein
MRKTPLALLRSLPFIDRPFGFTLAPEANTELDAEQGVRKVLALLDAAKARQNDLLRKGTPARIPERAYVRVSTWYDQRSYSDHSGVIVEPSDPARAEDRAAAIFLGDCLSAAFPVPKTGNYKPSGLVSHNVEKGETIYESGCYGIGD